MQHPPFELVVVAILLLLSIANARMHDLFSLKPTDEFRLESRSNGPKNASFVTTDGQLFFVDGLPFNFLGTDAYWLPMLNSTDNIRATLQSIKDTNLRVVRVWGFNDVVEVPPNNATYFQLFNLNGTISLNDGPTGLQRLDNVISVAQDLGLKILLTTTNNWNPANSNSNTRTINFTSPLSKKALTSPTNFPHGFLSNDYGGMDLYVSHFRGIQGTHDEFYTNVAIKAAYKNYLKALVSRYADNPTVFGWELANDPRCNSSISASSSCNTTTVTAWHSEIAQMITTLDSNHLVGSGAQGFQCMTAVAHCPKLFPLKSSASPLLISSTTARGKRSIRFNTQEIRDIIIDIGKRLLASVIVSQSERKQIRNDWVTTSITTRQVVNSPDGPSLKGSFGVDSQDILNIPQIGFSTFQVFPDQNNYFPLDPNLNASQNALETGANWIKTQAIAAQQIGKPSLLTAFGLVSQNSSAFFVPFNSSQLFNSSSNNAQPAKRDLISGLSDQDQSNIYDQWITIAIENGISGIMQYQWSQANLSLSGGGGVVTNIGGAITPNDGYGARSGKSFENPPPLPPATPLPPKVKHVGAIAGGSVGGFVLAGLVVYLIIAMIRRRRKSHGTTDFLLEPLDTEAAKSREISSLKAVSHEQQPSRHPETGIVLESSLNINSTQLNSHGISSADRDGQPTTVSNNMASSLPVGAQSPRIQPGGSTSKSSTAVNLATADTSSTPNPAAELRRLEEEITRLRNQNPELAINQQALPNSESSVQREVAELRAQMEELANRIGRDDDELPPTYSSV